MYISPCVLSSNNTPAMCYMNISVNKRADHYLKAELSYTCICRIVYTVSCSLLKDCQTGRDLHNQADDLHNKADVFI